MNIKKIVILLVFAVAIIGIIAPVNATLESRITGDYDTKNKPKTKLYLDVYSDIGMNSENYDSPKYVSKRKFEANKVNKIVVTIKGYKPITFKKPVKGWKPDKSGLFRVPFSVKGNMKTLKNKDYTIKLYDKNNEILKHKNKGKGKVGFGISNL